MLFRVISLESCPFLFLAYFLMKDVSDIHKSKTRDLSMEPKWKDLNSLPFRGNQYQPTVPSAVSLELLSQLNYHVRPSQDELMAGGSRINLSPKRSCIWHLL